MMVCGVDIVEREDRQAETGVEGPGPQHMDTLPSAPFCLSTNQPSVDQTEAEEAAKGGEWVEVPWFFCLSTSHPPKLETWESIELRAARGDAHFSHKPQLLRTCHRKVVRVCCTGFLPMTLGLLIYELG